MTTDSTAHKVTADDLFQPNDILNLSRAAGFRQPIAAISFVAKRSSIEVPWSDTISVAIDAAMEFVAASPWSEKKWMFFGATDMWRIPNALTRHKKFWGANDFLPQKNLLNTSPEIEFDYDAKVRYAVTAEVSREDVPIYGQWIRSTQSGLMFLESALEQQTAAYVQRCFAKAFTNGINDIDWSRAASTFCESDSILVRFSGSFDDPDSAVDFIYNPMFVALT